MSEDSSQRGGSADSVKDVRRNGLFDSTPRSEVLTAGDSRHVSNCSALEKLHLVYWPPLHAYLRWKVRDSHLAQDLTQSFFEGCLKGILGSWRIPHVVDFDRFLFRRLNGTSRTNSAKFVRQNAGVPLRFFPWIFIYQLRIGR
jgi:hypothetical protein